MHLQTHLMVKIYLPALNPIPHGQHLPDTTSSPHISTLSPLARHYIVLQINIGFMADQQLKDPFVSLPGCIRERCDTPLHTKEASADDSVRTCHVRMTVLGAVREVQVVVRVRG